MGRWAQAQRRGTVSPGETVGGALGAPDIGLFEILGKTGDVTYWWLGGAAPPGADGLWVQCERVLSGDWELYDAAALMALWISGQTVFNNDTAANWYTRCSWSLLSVQVSPWSETILVEAT